MFINDQKHNTSTKLVVDRLTDGQTDIATYRAAIAAKNNLDFKKKFYSKPFSSVYTSTISSDFDPYFFCQFYFHSRKRVLKIFPSPIMLWTVILLFSRLKSCKLYQSSKWKVLHYTDNESFMKVSFGIRERFSAVFHFPSFSLWSYCCSFRK